MHTIKRPTACSVKLALRLPPSPPPVTPASLVNIKSKIMPPRSRANFVHKVLRSLPKQLSALSAPTVGTKSKAQQPPCHARRALQGSSHPPKRQPVGTVQMESFNSWRSPSSTVVNFVPLDFLSLLQRLSAPSALTGSTKIKMQQLPCLVWRALLERSHQQKKRPVAAAKMESFKSSRAQSSTAVNFVEKVRNS